ncbi:phosphotransferase [Actinoplanes sp. LDG1-06]|uniref:Phosphotransferase n=1 Tax=Paractinoplanes ovalisporus TaxID=2810368 RepID=A0ABS2AVE2_9ACTN|nr:phosphotransferase [Actinoplanes ovalisporus]MBM2623848.1 phosphotransferase [Actinoplanes ovalisporus]
MDDVVADVCARMGLDGGDACLVQRSANVLFRLPGEGVMLRLSPQSVDGLVRIALDLARAGVPIGELTSRVPQALVSGDWRATAWELHPALDGRLPAADLARPLAALHAAKLSGLPGWDLVGTIRDFLAPLRSVGSAWAYERLGLPTAELVERLLARCDEIERALTTVAWTLPTGTVHGDAHPGNLLRATDGRVLLCDLDTVAEGPREVDLVPAAHGVARFGRDRRDYESFAERYGFDVLGAPAWPVLRRLRDLQLAVYLLPRPPADPVASAELEHRLRTVLDGDDNARWHRFTAFA